jgi:hypothetical protein
MTRAPDSGIFGDLAGKLDALVVSCKKCKRTGGDAVRRLIEQRGRDAKIITWKD